MENTWKGKTLEIRGGQDLRGSHKCYVELIPMFGSMVGDANDLLCLSCTVVAHRFAGATEPDEPVVYIKGEIIRHFVEELRTLERDRRGTATLAENQLHLTFEVYDRAGHTRVGATLSDHQMDGTFSVSVWFELDPTDLPRILGEFEDLLTFPYCR